jgi:hypothetical protein
MCRSSVIRWFALLVHWTKLENKEEGKILKEKSQMEGGPET